MSMAEFELLKETSAVTVMVIGTAKDVVMVACSILIFGDVFAENFFGMFRVGGHSGVQLPQGAARGRAGGE